MRISINLIRDYHGTLHTATLDVRSGTSGDVVVLSLSDNDRDIAVSKAQLVAALHALDSDR